MSDRTDLIEILEGQAVYINTCRRDNHLGRIKLLLKEEILSANVKALGILRGIKPCAGCRARQIEIDRLAVELGSLEAKVRKIRRVLALYEEQMPANPYIRYEGEPVLAALARILGRPD